MILVMNCDYCGEDHFMGDPCEQFADHLNSEGYSPQMVAMIDGLAPHGWAGYRAFMTYLDSAVELEIRGMPLKEIGKFLMHLKSEGEI